MCIIPELINTLQFMGVKLIFTSSHSSLAVAFKGLNVILGLYKCNCSLTRGKELGPDPGVETRCPIKQDGGPDSARGPCVCHLCSTWSDLVEIYWQRRPAYLWKHFWYILLLILRNWLYLIIITLRFADKVIELWNFF